MIKFYYLLVILLIISCFTTTTTFAAEVGDSCVIRSTGLNGICKLSSECSQVIEEAKRGINPTICGYYQLTIPIVCCEARFAQPNDNTLNNRPGPIAFPEETESPPTRSLRKCERKCQEYNKLVTDFVEAIALVSDSKPHKVEIEKCTYLSVALIVGGKAASAGQFPFMALLGYLVDNKIQWRCGGTLISERYVLTAAHCANVRDGELRVVRLGELDINSDEDGSEYADYNIADIIVHPKYNYPLKYNDITLLKLEREVKFTKFVRPACLYTRSTFDEPKVIAAGWGKVDYTELETSSKLMRVVLQIFDNTLCQRTYGNGNNLPEGIKSSMLCAGDLKGGKDTCYGDSGGPLVVSEKANPCKFSVLGVTSFGKSCGHENTPAVYTKVSEYIDWIEDTVW